MKSVLDMKIVHRAWNGGPREVTPIVVFAICHSAFHFQVLVKCLLNRNSFCAAMLLAERSEPNCYSVC